MKSEKPRRQSNGDNKRSTQKSGPSVRRQAPSGKESVWRITPKDNDDDTRRPKRTSTTTRTRSNDTTGPAKRSSRSVVDKSAAPKRIKTSEERPRRRNSESTVNDNSSIKKRVIDRSKTYADKQVKPKLVKTIRKSSAKKDEVRLNKFIANSGICSRREADEFIEAGVVTVNGEVITTLGTKVKPTDDIRFNGQRLQGEKKVYILLNKPKNYVTTVEDPHAEKTVMELIEGACKERVYPVGRLDRNTTGVLLFTNDGELTKQLTHPSSEKMKVYHVFLDKDVTRNDLVKLAEGFDLEDGFIQADAVDYVDGKKSEVGVEIHSGRNHIVRRMFEHLGYKVTKLDRVYFAGLTKKGLQRGEWRILTPKEINMLKIGAFD